MGVLFRYLIPLSGFFVFIDELGRNLFGEQSLFGVWDEVYLLLCVILLVFSWIMNKDSRAPATATPLDVPIFLLISVSFFLYLNYSTHPHIGFEGMRSVVQFVLWFYVFSRYLDSDNKLDQMISGLILTGGFLVSMGSCSSPQGLKRRPTGWMLQREPVRFVFFSGGKPEHPGKSLGSDHSHNPCTGAPKSGDKNSESSTLPCWLPWAFV